ncbi:GNAT family N-acetyltransferase [Streptomyces gilvifuscus]|uniref:GNAT family N-acetyltransferase n=1 Tax=Streptomyces gilvifuscus TaxID=1550617 RepID=A0ABT5G6Y5_9ACTN|nr:GNAT family N-acetyltransferase [Streptomyces gilvifuscus]MDC2960529.1 GNAT family N-acetyltransferase [Streptomyces gilvifuscus]
MTDHHGISVVRWPGRAPLSEDGPARLLTAYHLQTQAEKGEVVAGVDELPERYRAEVLDPRAAFVDDVVLLALSGDAAVGCLVLTAPVDGRAELKRLWTDPDHRGLGVASGLVGAALAHAERGGAGVVRLSVWKWRAGAIALYERLGFTVSASWDERVQLVCMERVM